MTRNASSPSASWWPRTQANLFIWVPNWITLIGSSMVSQRLYVSKGRTLVCTMSLSWAGTNEYTLLVAAFHLRRGHSAGLHSLSMTDPFIIRHITVQFAESRICSPVRLPYDYRRQRQFAGFGSVIGTMWAVDGSETNDVIPSFYKPMIDDLGCQHYTRAARGLWMMMKKVDIPMDQRVLYIHLKAQSL